MSHTLQPRLLRSAADQHELGISAPLGLQQVFDGLEQDIHAVLRAHHAEVDHQQRFAFFQLRIRSFAPHLLRNRADADDEDVVRGLRSPLDGDFPVGPIRGKRNGRGLERQPLCQAHQTVEKVLPVELRQVELGRQVQMVEDEPHAEWPVNPRHEENQIGGIPGVEDLEAAPCKGSEREPQPRRHRPAVFEEITEWPRSLKDAVAINVNVVNALVARFAAGALGADYGDAVARVAERAALLPRPADEGHGQIFDDHQDPDRAIFRHVRNSLDLDPLCIPIIA